MDQQDRQRWWAMVVFQVLWYGFLLAMFIVQLSMYATRDW